MLGNEAVLELVFPVLRVPARREAQLELLHRLTDNRAHLMHGQRLAHAVRRAMRERGECVGVVRESRGLRELFLSNEPSLRPELLRLAEVACIALDRVEV